MVCKSAILAGALLIMTAAASPASAVTVGPHGKAPVATGDSLVQPVQWGYCAHWRRVCSDQWGWNTRRYYLCLQRHNCDFLF